MTEDSKRRARIAEVQRIFEEYELGSVDLLESFDGEKLDELAELLTEEEFQTLLDELEEGDDPGSR